MNGQPTLPGYAHSIDGEGNEARLGQLSALYDDYSRRFEQSGNLEDLDTAINYGSQVVDLVSPNNPLHQSASLDNLAALHMRRYERCGTVEDIDRAVELYDRAVLVTPRIHPDLPERLKRLGDALQTRFDHMNTPADIERSIECHNQAVMLTRDAHKNPVSANEAPPDLPPVINDSMHAAKELFVWSKCDHPSVQKLLGIAEVRGQIAMVSPWMVNGDVRKFMGQENVVDRCSMLITVDDDSDIKASSAPKSRTDLSIFMQRELYMEISKELQSPFCDESYNEEDINAVVGKYNFYRSIHLRLSEIVRLQSCLKMVEDIPWKQTSMRWEWYVIDIGGYRRLAHMILLSDYISTRRLYVTWEILTGLVPFEGKNELQVMAAIFSNKHPPRPENVIPSSSKQGDALWSLLIQCWDRNPAARPTAVEVRDRIPASSVE
ncbi:hypothetical protein FRC10_011093 [Ceratobasidium sp. 414]|nr:hypothetical protein FRC10_011093 [Ceratobasidium sp. 414]